jgi:integrase
LQKTVTLTETRVGNAQPRAKRYRIADSGQPGLYLRVYPSGARSYWVRGRVGSGRSARDRDVKIGDPGSMTIPEARARARELVGQMAAGQDPLLISVDRVTVEQALGAYEAALKRRGIVKRKEVISSLRSGLAGLEGVPVASLRRPDLVARIDALDADSRPGAAQYLRKSITSWLSDLVNRGTIPASPMAGYRRERTSRERRLQARPRTVYGLEELGALWEALGAASDPVFASLMRLGLLTGLRRGELAALEWAWLDGGTITIPAAFRKTGEPHTVFLGPLSLRIVERQPRTTSPLIFPGRGGKPISGWSKRLSPVMEELPGFTMHALRRTYRTGLGELGIDFVVAELMVGHARTGLAARYDHSQRLEARWRAQDMWEHSVSVRARLSIDGHHCGQ